VYTGWVILDGYVRVSQVRGREGERFISPSVQREQIMGWATARGAAIAVMHEELDESGARADRPKLMLAVSRIEDGTVDGLVVAHLDRFGRSVLHGLTLIDRIRTAGGTFVSVRENFDISTGDGRQMLRTMLSNAEWRLDEIRASWDVARQRAVARGMHTGAYAPTGYLRSRARRLRPDPRVAPVIAEMFRRRAEGALIVELRALLEEAGVRSSRGRTTWCGQSVAALLCNRVYRGELRSGIYFNAAAHIALVDEPTWQAAQRKRIVGPCFTTVQPTPIGGLVRCAGCSLALNSGTTTTTAGHHRAYHCPTASGSGNCPAPARIRGWELEHLMEEAFFTVARQQRPVRPDARATRMLRQAEQALTDYRDHPTLLSRLGPTRFAAGLDVRLARVQRYALAVADDRSRVAARGDARPAEEWERAWPTMPVTARRDAIASVLDCGFARRGSGPLAERFWACPRGEGPHDLVARLRIARTPIAFDPVAYTTVKVAPAPRWPLRRIREELREFLAERSREASRGLVDTHETPTQWPSEHQFLIEGRGPLLRQIDATGGQDAWARRVGVPWRRTTTRLDYWTDERIRASLVEIMRNRTDWPEHRHWLIVAPGGLGREIRNENARWAAEFGFSPRRRPRWTRWTPETITATVIDLAGESRVYPTEQRFIDAGYGGLYRKIAVAEGHRHCARRLRLRCSTRTAAHCSR
jgi:DNA invertase Pin-like site-specific DNA recombinase